MIECKKENQKDENGKEKRSQIAKKMSTRKQKKWKPKEKMQECMQIINSNTAKLPIAVGDVLIENVFGSNIVATQNRSK